MGATCYIFFPNFLPDMCPDQYNFQYPKRLPKREARAPSRPTTFLFLQLTNEHVPTNGKLICVFVSVLVC
jgi:hypothetical protein